VKTEAFQEKKQREYLKHKIDELATSGKNKNVRDMYRGINYFKKGCQPGSNLVKDDEWVNKQMVYPPSETLDPT
jgi:hypothetical protein